MKQKQRKAVLDKLREGWAWDSWQIVSGWIKRMVSMEPTVMRRVAKAKFGNLSKWIQRGRGNVGVCGCLVGTVALELVKSRNHFEPKLNDVWAPFVRTTGELAGERESCPTVVSELVKQRRAEMEHEADQAGLEAASLRGELGQETAVALIKDEIKRALAARRRRVAKPRKVA